MKKLLLLSACCTFSFSSLVNAQECMALFPTNEGAVMINQTFDKNDNLMGSMTYRVNESYDYGSNKDILIGFTITDGLNNVIDSGNIDARCDDGTFFLKMINRAICPEAIDLLVENTELVGNFLDYPNTFDINFPFDNTFAMDGGEYYIRSKSDKKDLIKVRIYNRNYEKNEKVGTPAGSFDTSKVTFTFDVTRNGEIKTYHGTEWYAVGAGIVKSETYDKDNNLQNYTVLTTLRDNK